MVKFENSFDSGVVSHDPALLSHLGHRVLRSQTRKGIHIQDEWLFMSAM